MKKLKELRAETDEAAESLTDEAAACAGGKLEPFDPLLVSMLAQGDALDAERDHTDHLLAAKDQEIATLRKGMLRTMELGDLIEEDLRRAGDLAKCGRKEGAKNVLRQALAKVRERAEWIREVLGGEQVCEEPDCDLQAALARLGEEE